MQAIILEFYSWDTATGAPCIAVLEPTRRPPELYNAERLDGESKFCPVSIAVVVFRANSFAEKFMNRSDSV